MSENDANLMSPGKAYVPMCQGGEGSGNFGHEGRPGEVGGSGPGGGISERASKAISKYGDQLRNEKKERIIVLDKFNEPLLDKSGSKHEINLSKDDMYSLLGEQNLVSIHNHPDDVPHSEADISFAARTQSDHAIVVTGNHDYIISPSDKGWSAVSFRDEIHPAISSEYESRKGKYMDLFFKEGGTREKMNSRANQKLLRDLDRRCFEEVYSELDKKGVIKFTKVNRQ